MVVLLFWPICLIRKAARVVFISISVTDVATGKITREGDSVGPESFLDFSHEEFLKDT
jgi:hypothetical protein